MARPQSPPILDQLRNAQTLAEQFGSLQALKNEIVGHRQKKEAWLAFGVLDHIVACFSLHRSAAKAVARDVCLQQSQMPLSDEDGVRLQALQIITSFAHGQAPHPPASRMTPPTPGARRAPAAALRFTSTNLAAVALGGCMFIGGPAFLQPIHAAGALPAILTCISPSANPTQIVVAALKALISIANASVLALPPNPLDIPTLADSIFSPPHLESFCHMLTTTSAKHLFSQSPSSLASTLICRLCREERHQHALATSGVLDMLATQLASFAVAQGCVVPGAEEEAYRGQLFDLFPEPAHPDAKIGTVLEAISVILGDSRYRSARLVNSPAVLAVFPCIRFQPPEGGFAVKKGRGKVTAMEYLLPKTYNALPTASSRAAPSDLFARRDLESPRKSPADQHRHAAQSMADIQPGMRSGCDEDDIESPLIPWLILQFRSLSGHERLMAASVLVCLYKSGLGRPAVREITLGMLVLPGLIELIRKTTKDGILSGDAIDATRCLILERAPVVLAHLMADSDYLQKAAFECSAVKVLTSLLRKAYEPVTALDQPKAWSPHSPKEMNSNTPPDDLPLSSRLGPSGQNPILMNRLRLREAALKAIGTLASGADDYRKAFADEDFLPYVVESLFEHPSKPRQLKDRAKDKPANIEASAAAPAASGYGTNPPSVIIAGCHVVRMLARSISNLRTLLVDYAVATPVFGFLRHPDVSVQIAATAAICNLVVEASPVRELLIESGVMEVLCEHAHSGNAALRLNALWALKHLVVAVSPGVKKACLAQLEPDWMLQLISGDDPARCSSMTGYDVDQDMEAPPPLETFRWPYVTNGTLRELDSSRSSKLRQVEEFLVSIHEAEVDPVRRARLDDIAVQEQGLDLIRNLIGPGEGLTAESPCDTSDMIDHLLATLGQEQFFDVLTSKLHAKVLNPYYRRGAGAIPGRDTIVVHPQAKVIASVIWVLVHIAASTSRHREMIVSQTGLLKQLALQASSKDREVRVALCHLIINLTGQEDEDAEVRACARRAMELKKLGFQLKMQKLHEFDQDLNVRERAKTAVWQLNRVVSC